MQPDVAGRFVLFEPMGDKDAYITSWDTWEEAGAAFPIEGKCVLRDDATLRELPPYPARTPLEAFCACPFCRRVWPKPHLPACRLHRGRKRG